MLLTRKKDIQPTNLMPPDMPVATTESYKDIAIVSFLQYYSSPSLNIRGTNLAAGDLGWGVALKWAGEKPGRHFHAQKHKKNHDLINKGVT